MRRGAKVAKAKVEAELPVARRSLKSKGPRGGKLEKRLAEALEQQAATAEVLKLISRSTFEIQPVLAALIENATRLCDATLGVIYRPDGEVLRVAVHYGGTPAFIEFWRRSAISPGRGSGTGRAALEQRSIHILDVTTDPEYELLDALKLGNIRTLLCVPMLRESVLVGVISMWRTEVRAFTERQIELVTTFADQAVIAIENVRLFKELEGRNRDLTQALDQQTATADVLAVIGSSPTDVQPVFDAIVASARRLLGGFSSGVFRLVEDEIHLVALTSTTPSGDAAIRRNFPRPLSAFSTAREAIRTRTPVVLTDIETDPRIPDDFRKNMRERGFRSGVWVPMLREGVAIGAIGVTRSEAGGFGGEEIALLQTFADQAVIAIENVRLFKELAARNRELTDVLARQTATSEVLKVISRSAFDLQPVFDTMAENAVRLCGAERAFIFRFDGELLRAVASYNVGPELTEFVDRNPIAPGRHSVSARAALERRTVHIPDVQADPDYAYAMRDEQPIRTMLAVPMLKAADLVGTITIYRLEVKPFTDKQVELVETFADQAVIAIENVRLFRELEARTQELTQSVEQLTALGEVSRAVSSTLDVETVLDTIVSRASLLASADGCMIYEYDEATERFHVRATHNLEPAFEEAIRQVSIRKGEGVGGRAAELRESFQVADITQPGAYQSSIRDLAIQAGYRAALAVPLLREDEVIGSLTLTRKTPGDFSPEIVETLKTFATQSALAIQNARLFREIADKSAQLEAASRHKSEFLANMSHELRTPLNAIIGFSEVLTERMFGELNDKQDEYLRDIYASGQHLLSLINDILDLSKIEAGRMELELTDFDLPSAIDNALILVRERASRRGITLGHSVDERLGSIRGDERKVKQVLLNLLSNALKFTPEGGRIDVRAAPQDGVVEIAVADTGVGIAPEDQEAVFEEFRQVGTADKKVEGTGLGLALSRKFIELHGGRIWVESEVGKGSTFTFSLPVGHGA